jgi:hypothetical protein
MLPVFVDGQRPERSLAQVEVLVGDDP